MSYYYHRRRSIFSGLILILFGVIFLLYEFHPEFPIGHLFRRYWPLILIVWGIAHLIEHLLATRTGGPRPAGISGGEIALMIVLFMVVASIAGFDWVRKQNPDINFDMGDVFDHSYDWSNDLPAVSAKPNEVISILTQRGNIAISPSSDSEIHVSVHKSARASNENDARRLADKITVAVNPTGDGFQIQPQVTGGETSDVRVDLDIRLPVQSSITSHTTRGDITVAQMRGPLTIHSQSGDLEIHDIAGDVNAEMAHGDVRANNIKGNVRLTGSGGEVDLSGVSGDATIEGDFYGPIRAQKVDKTVRYTSSRTSLTLAHLTGQLEMDSGDLTISDQPGGVQLRTSNKDVTLENVAGRIDLTDQRGDVEVTFKQPPRDEILIADQSGNIDLTLPAQSSFEISAVSRKGEIDNDFGSSGLKSGNNGDTTVLQGVYGTHGPHITLNTTYGTISIHKAQ
ncbi:MAG TPA: DUF4097 family beta strand repeat-containing protein [Candidatus Acidoferrales bacterium]|nr:DUF4097 family beta strand repeat-containing protein [Candidatus Acidoferrales bacterium]